MDVVFTQDATALAVSAQSPAPADPGASTTAPVTVTFNAPLAAGATLGLTAGGATVAGHRDAVDRRADPHLHPVGGARAVDDVHGDGERSGLDRRQHPGAR